jgi:diaminohydroxyphosphoribosylaminopyrimidine deaminase/5-amino-6-(5-phosphoribosylamino)uracil reductase
MALALALARRGLGVTWPNPSVGCVIVKNGRIVGRGVTAPGGRPHAEVVALAQAGASARGATAYVSLEPCAHHGRTPPCAEALVAAGVARVVSALEDPDERVSGRGHAILRGAGIAVETGVLAAEAAEVGAGFLARVRRGRPWLTLKLAASLDGRIATASGESRWITGDAARARVHGMRASHDAVMVGGGTVRADDPELTVRGWGARRQPVRVVASRYLDLPRDCRLARTARETPVLLLHRKGAEAAPWVELGARVIEVAAGPDRQLAPVAMLEALAAQGMTRVLCEGGGALASSLLAAGVVDELVVFHAGLALGAEGWPGIGAMGLGALAEAPRFGLVEAGAVGADVMSRWRPHVR